MTCQPLKPLNPLIPKEIHMAQIYLRTIYT
jgi:hypothetical protein